MNLSTTAPLRLSASLRHRPKPPKPHALDHRHTFTIDLDPHILRAKTAASLTNLLRSSTQYASGFASDGAEALEDFRTLVTLDRRHSRLVLSFRHSTVWFLLKLTLWGLLVYALVNDFRVKLGSWRGFGGGGAVSRRDRSLGGREVVVEKRRSKKGVDFRVPVNPLSLRVEDVRRVEGGAVEARRKWGLGVEELPEWWPDSVGSPSVARGNVELQREADRVIQAIMDNKMCGKDITGDDILQFRRICKASGAKVNIETTNSRDSFYRASVDFVLNFCSSSGSISSDIQIDGEDAKDFVAGLADSIGLKHIHAARIVSAAVAARTRSWFLQAWALEMQDKRAEALKELSKICLIHRIFPPKESSPEMEMVARGLEKHLRVEQRKLLLNRLVEACGSPSRGAVEALGLLTPRSVLEDGFWSLTS